MTSYTNLGPHLGSTGRLLYGLVSVVGTNLLMLTCQDTVGPRSRPPNPTFQCGTNEQASCWTPSLTRLYRQSLNLFFLSIFVTLQSQSEREPAGGNCDGGGGGASSWQPSPPYASFLAFHRLLHTVLAPNSLSISLISHLPKTLESSKP